MKNAITDARTLAYYIKQKNSSDGSISPLKLQKALYFCFAYWGGFVRKQTMGNSEITTNYSEFLFANQIEAWVYGPVVPDVYHESDLKEWKNENIFPDEFVHNYIDGILEDVLKASDFALVNASHQDKCWKDNFKNNAPRHNSIIKPEEIIKEYAKL